MEYKFHNKAYEMASIVEINATDSALFREIDWEQPETVQSILKPSKICLLHRYIYAAIFTYESAEYRENSDLYWDACIENNDLEETFTIYGISVEPFRQYIAELDTKENNNLFYAWFLLNEAKFELLWEKITEEVFHVLFANRAFLLKFNSSLADFLKQGLVKIPPSYLDKKGVVKRHSIPAWVKKAVYFRDHGRCVLCNKDLTGLLSTDQTLHYDHIVPLKLWGTNDPCNIQLLCEKCNLEKSGNLVKTGYRYPMWWDS